MGINNKSCCARLARKARKPASKFFAIAFLLAAFFAGRAVPAARAADAPDWLRAVATAPVPKYSDDTKAVVLLDDETVTVQSNGDVIEHYRLAYKILRSTGRNRGVLGLEESGQMKIVSMKGWGIPATGKELAVTERDAVEHGLFDNASYSDLREQVLQAPAADPGNVVGFEYEIRARLDLLQETWDFQGEDPVREARFTLVTPPGWEYDMHWINHAEIPAQQDSPNQSHWAVQDVPGVDIEDDAPPEVALEAHAVLNFAPTDPALRQKTLDSWKEFGLWDNRQTAGRRDDSPEIEAKVKELTANAATPVDKMRAITVWMQKQIRYYAVEIGVGGYQPHPASEVFAHGFGDCKDKATLLSSMLKDAGIDSYYVLIQHERGQVRPDDPPWDAFDHMILAIRLPAGTNANGLYATYEHPQLGTLVFFDATDDLDPLGYLPTSLQANYGLLMTEQGGELVELPLLPPPTNRLLRQEQYSLYPTGEPDGAVKEIRWGEPATVSRAQIREAVAQDSRADMLESFLAKFVPGFDLTDARAENLDDLSSNLILDFQFIARNYAQSSGDLLLVRPRVMGEWGNTILEDSSKPRQYPVDLGATQLLSDVVEITLPAGYAVTDLPDPVKADYPFASYNSKVEYDGKVLRYTRTLQIKSVLVPTEQLADLKKFYETVGQDENASAVLKRTASN
jgi:transglutaminase-like putative cysteine protease